MACNCSSRGPGGGGEAGNRELARITMEAIMRRDWCQRMQSEPMHSRITCRPQCISFISKHPAKLLNTCIYFNWSWEGRGHGAGSTNQGTTQRSCRRFPPGQLSIVYEIAIRNWRQQPNHRHPFLLEPARRFCWLSFATNLFYENQTCSPPQTTWLSCNKIAASQRSSMLQCSC